MTANTPAFNGKIDFDSANVGAKFNGDIYTIINKATNNQWVTWDPGYSFPATAAPIWLQATYPLDLPQRDFIIGYDAKTGGVTIKTVFYQPAWPERWVGNGPSLRPEVHYCRLYEAKDQDEDGLYYISPDMTTSPPTVITDPQPRDIPAYGSLVLDPIEGGNTRQMWKIVKRTT